MSDEAEVSGATPSRQDPSPLQAQEVGYRLPPAGSEPPPGRAEIEAFTAMGEASLPAARASAQAWRNGLSAMITLLASGAVVGGRMVAAELPVGWRVAVTVAVGGSLALAVRGLWLALSAEAGRRAKAVRLDQVLHDHATVTAYRIAEGNRAVRDLQRARNAIGAALVLLLAGVFLTWWAPAVDKQPAAYALVTWTNLDVSLESTTCGRVQSGDGGVLRLVVRGQHEPVVVPYTRIRNVAVVTTCPSR